MNSRLIRILIVVIGIAIGLSAGYLFSNVDKDINTQRTSENALRDEAAALAATIADVRAGQMAYVARGQGEAFWMSHVESLTPILQKRAAEFGALLTAPDARSTFEAATAALENFRTLDAKVRESVRNGSALFAADMIFSDGLESMATASTQLTAALNQELQSRSAAMTSVRNRQLAIAGGAAGAILLLMVGLVLLGEASAKSAEPEAAAAVPVVEPIRFEAPLPKARAAVTPKLLTTAQLCRELSRVVDSSSLPHCSSGPRGSLTRPASSCGSPSRRASGWCLRSPMATTTARSCGWAASTVTRTTPRRPPIGWQRFEPSRETRRRTAPSSFR